MQLLDNLYNSKSAWLDNSQMMRERRAAGNFSTASQIYEAPKMLSLLFRTYKDQGQILYAATNQMFTSLSLQEGRWSTTPNSTFLST